MNRLEAYEMLLGESFGIDLNANDFFHYATAQLVTIPESDYHWVIEHIQQYGLEGVYSAMAYIQNEEPLPPYRTTKFDDAIKELVDRKQAVNGDIDWQFYYYNDNGPYRVINKD